MDTRTAATAPRSVVGPVVNVDAQLTIIKTRMPETYQSIKTKAAEAGQQVYALVRRGLRGEANCFYALERGHVMGTPFDQAVMAEVAQYMVQWGCAYVCIWPDGLGAQDAAH